MRIVISVDALLHKPHSITDLQAAFRKVGAECDIDQPPGSTNPRLLVSGFPGDITKAMFELWVKSDGQEASAFLESFDDEDIEFEYNTRYGEPEEISPKIVEFLA